ncbi:helix-turn-helix domain-containing protein [Streptomyces sp. NPDC048279]|uniref:helix-turn-helix domain-containing protein n=1 Tax=Streptomyces sp. NPDC048279 TaxID=3154714 RepID=UPI00344704D7
MTRADRRTLVRQLADEGLSQRKIAGRLGVSKDTVRRDLENTASQGDPGDAPDDEPDGGDAPQVSDAVAAEGAPLDAPGDEPDDGGAPQDAPPADPGSSVAHARPVEDAPPALPRRIPAGQTIVLDLDQSPTLRRGLAELAATGLPPEALIAQAIAVLAVGYRQGVARGEIRPDRPFLVRSTTVGPPEPGRALPIRHAPPAPARGA